MAKLSRKAEGIAMSDKSYLSELPADLKAHILRRLTPQMLLSCLQSSKAFWHEDDESLWRTLCKHHLPAHMTKFLQEPAGRLLRSRVDARRSLFHGLKRQQELRAVLLHELANAGVEMEELNTSHRIEHVVLSLTRWVASRCQTHAVAYSILAPTVRCSDAMKRLRDHLHNDPLLQPSQRHPSHGGATLLHLAALHNRTRCVRVLVDFSADVDALDDLNMSPLAVGAWAGNEQVVRMLLDAGASLDARGIPPMSSACGGKGPYTAEEWARRKADLYHRTSDLSRASQFRCVERLLVRARKDREQPASGQGTLHRRAYVRDHTNLMEVPDE